MSYLRFGLETQVLESVSWVSIFGPEIPKKRRLPTQQSLNDGGGIHAIGTFNFITEPLCCLSLHTVLLSLLKYLPLETSPQPAPKSHPFALQS